jgi:hypothetical protein
MLIGDEYHRRINFHNGYPYHIYIVEGMGSGAGILSGYSDYYGFEGMNVLKCFKVNDTLLYEDQTYNFTQCELFTSTNNTVKPIDLDFLRISPNPVLLNSYLTVDYSLPIELFFYDLSGHLIEHTKSDNSGKVFISKINFNRGAFIVIAKSKNHVIAKNLVLTH